MPRDRPAGQDDRHKDETPVVGRSRTTRRGRYRSAFSFWNCSAISPALVERVTPMASLLFPSPRYTLINQTLPIDAPTAFFTRLRCGQALRQASHHAGKEAFENSHGVPHISNSSHGPFCVLLGKTLYAWWTRLVRMFASEMTAGSTSPPAMVAAIANGSLPAVTRAIVTCGSRLTTTR